MPEANLQKLKFSDSIDFLTQALQSTPNLTPEHIEANEARPNPATYFMNLASRYSHEKFWSSWPQN